MSETTLPGLPAPQAQTQQEPERLTLTYSIVTRPVTSVESEPCPTCKGQGIRSQVTSINERMVAAAREGRDLPTYTCRCGAVITLRKRLIEVR